MLYLLYNPLAASCRKASKVKKIEKKATFFFKKKESMLINLLKLKEQDFNKFFLNIKETDIIVITGGDGTLHNVCNMFDFNNYLHDNIYLLKSGTGNDFQRSLNVKKRRFIKITKYLKNLPKATILGKELNFLNGIGIGIDGYITYLLEEQKKSQSRGNFFAVSMRAFRDFKRFPLKVSVDGKEYHFPETWFCAVMNSSYFGGGMKISPNSNREKKELRVITIHTVNKIGLLFRFPIIYSRGALCYKKFVTELVGNNITVSTKNNHFLQVDGEVYSDIKSFTATK